MNKTEEEINEQETEQEAQKEDEITEKERELIERYEGLEKEELIELLVASHNDIGNLEQEAGELKDTVLRKAAELDNYRKRVKRERSQIYRSAKEKAFEDFLDLNDDLKRTLDASEASEVPESFLEGVTLLGNKFEEVLQKHGVKRIDETLVPFNVELHDAMMSQKPEDESIKSDMVLQVVENGYKIDDQVVRHAKVIVSE